MDALRWILLAVAIIIIVAIYFFSRSRNKEQSGSPLEAVNDMPSFSAAESTSENEQANNEWMHGVGPVRVLEKNEVDQQVADQQLAQDFRGEFKTSEAIDKQRDPIAPVVQDINKASESTEDLTEKKLDEPVSQRSQPKLKQSEAIVKRTVESSENNNLTESNNDSVEEISEAAIDDVISVYVLASDEEPLINGDKILSASYALHLEHGDMKIFHRHSDALPHGILFSMANIQNPGWFDVERMNDLSTRGMSFFMQVNLVDNPSRVLDDMLICAHQMATMLGGILCNPQREPLDEAYTTILREKVKYLETIKSQSV